MSTYKHYVWSPVSQTLEEHEESAAGPTFLDWRDVWDQTQEAVKGCNHEWRHYVGFTDVYNYCVKCDAKCEERE